MYMFDNRIRENQERKASFFQLAKEVFGLRFDLWEQAGGWTSAYMPYCFLENDQVVANASVNLMKLTIDGVCHDALQIGTVMTREAYRGNGLAGKLLQKILDDYEGKTDLLFLCAEEKAMSLYRRAGFVNTDTVRYLLPAKAYFKEGPALLPVKRDLVELLKMKETSVPVTDLIWSKEDKHILPFYYVHGFQEMVLAPSPHVTILGEVKGDTFHLYDVLSTMKISLQEVLSSVVPADVQQVELHFTPSEHLPGLYTEPALENGFMVHRSSTVHLPKIFAYPRIITA